MQLAYHLKPELMIIGKYLKSNRIRPEVITHRFMVSIDIARNLGALPIKCQESWQNHLCWGVTFMEATAGGRSFLFHYRPRS
jgi:hypothetical protein